MKGSLSGWACDFGNPSSMPPERWGQAGGKNLLDASEQNRTAANEETHILLEF
jgi:hypothetical protein